MAFFSEQQVRLRLSREAEEVIQNDMNYFQERKRNSFINTVLENYYADAKASIGLRLDEYESELESVMKNSGHSKLKEENISLLLAYRRESLEALANSYGKPGIGCPNNPVRLKNQFYEYLTDEHTGSRENHYNNYSLAQYLRTILEEYARLPYLQREQIYYKDRFRIIRSAIESQRQLQISVASSKEIKTFYVLPYQIMHDPLSTVSYLVGYAYAQGEDKSFMKTCSFRIATIHGYRLQKSRSAKLSSEKIDHLLKEIDHLGVQFLSSENIEVRVRFTEHGLRQFDHQLNLRPAPLQKDGNIYTFHCSETQARYYFFKFGRHAEILAPESLRKEFRKKYQDAYKLYRN